MTKIRQKILVLHFVVLAICLCHALLKYFTSFSLIIHLEFILELVVAISGLSLFFFYLKPFRKINLYFSVYALATLLLLIGITVRGIFWAMVLSVILFPIIPDSDLFQDNEIIVSSPFQDIMAPCCTYQIRQRHFLIFQEDLSMLNLEGNGPIDFESVVVKNKNGLIQIDFSTEFEPDSIQTTSINIK